MSRSNNKTDLNELLYRIQGPQGPALDSCAVRPMFSDLEDNLRYWIQGSQRIVGCVSWLTSLPVLADLAKCEAVSLVVQKEEFLRPDLAPHDGWRKRLRAHYDALPGGIDAESFDFRYSATDDALTSLDEATFQNLEAVRCCGIVDSSASNVPRMHHKFLVFFVRLHDEHRLVQETGMQMCVPAAVWTGSFNPSANGSRSLDNAVLLIPHWMKDLFDGKLSDRDYGNLYWKSVLRQYVDEWARVVSISDPLDWEYADVPEPEEVA